MSWDRYLIVFFAFLLVALTLIKAVQERDP